MSGFKEFVPRGTASEFVPAPALSAVATQFTPASAPVAEGGGSLSYNSYVEQQPATDAAYAMTGQADTGTYVDYGGTSAAVPPGMYQQGVQDSGVAGYGMENFGMPVAPVPPMDTTIRTTYSFLLPHLDRAAKTQPAAPTFFMGETLRTELLDRQRAVMLQPDVPGAGGVPAQLDNYHSLYPLEHVNIDGSVNEPGKVFGFHSVLYKGISDEDGLPYALRRIEGARVTDAKAMSRVDVWKSLIHPNIITIREAFSKTFADTGKPGTVFVHDFHPLAQTLEQRHLLHRAAHISESLLWSYVIQLTSALRAIHGAGLACRVVDVSKVIVTGRSRIAISSTCIYDVLQYDESKLTPPITAHFQQRDLQDLGILVLTLACNSRRGVTQELLPSLMHNMSQVYSEDMFKLVAYLLSPPGPGQIKSLNDLMPMIGARFYTELEAQSMYSSTLEGELSKELHNGRLLRLATKLEFVIDRPEQVDDPRWSDTGDRFLLKLMKDYIFHQIQESGEPWLDFSHVVQSLNKLDCGDAERICLVTPDEQNVMVVSYADLQRCLLKAYTELSALK